MAALDFPSTGLVHGQVDASGNYFWDSSISAWRSNGTTSAMGPRVTDLENPLSVKGKTLYGMVPIKPSSIAADSGTATLLANGRVNFSSVGALKLNGVFTSQYSTYRLIMDFETSTASEWGFRFGTNGTYEGGNTYVFTGTLHGTDSSTVANYYTTGTSAMLMGYVNTVGGASSAVLDIFNAPLATRTTVNFMTSGWYGAYKSMHGHGFLTLNQAMDGIQLWPLSSYLSGNIMIYGYNS